MFLRGRLFFADGAARDAMATARRRQKEVAPSRAVALGELERTSTAGREAWGEATGALAIPPSSPRSPFQAGTGYYCREDRLTYRVLQQFDPAEGWATAAFWKERWRITYGGLLQLAREGLVDALLIEGSQIRRYRCRDEARVLRSEVVLRAALLRKREARTQASRRASANTESSRGGRRGGDPRR